jgi:hypothetical protein
MLKQKGYRSELIRDESISKKFESWGSTNITTIYQQKFHIIYQNLLHNNFVCFTDGDIVFLDKTFLNYCLNNIGDNDIIIQNDSLIESQTSTLCSGFMFIKSNKLTMDLFNPEKTEALNINSNIKFFHFNYFRMVIIITKII